MLVTDKKGYQPPPWRHSPRPGESSAPHPSEAPSPEPAYTGCPILKVASKYFFSEAFSEKMFQTKVVWVEEVF